MRSSRKRNDCHMKAQAGDKRGQARSLENSSEACGLWRENICIYPLAQHPFDPSTPLGNGDLVPVSQSWSPPLALLLQLQAGSENTQLTQGVQVWHLCHPPIPGSPEWSLLPMSKRASAFHHRPQTCGGSISSTQEAQRCGQRERSSLAPVLPPSSKNPVILPAAVGSREPQPAYG